MHSWRRDAMLKRGLFVVVALAVICSLSSCGKQEAKKGSKAASEKVKPEINTKDEVFIPAGSFIYGTNSKDTTAIYATPQQNPTLKAFWIDKYETTNMQFLEFSVKTGYGSEGNWRAAMSPAKALFPVANITWNDANAYCKSINKRLPTEEEWEKAARGPNGNVYPWGNEWKTNSTNTAESGLKNATNVGEFDDVSSYGVHDMFGNVQEWTSSRFLMYKGNTTKYPSGDKMRVVRGLSPWHPGMKSHLYDRTGTFPDKQYGFGCRCARDATPEEIAKAPQPK